MSRQAATAYDVAHHYDTGYFRELAGRYTRRNRFARQRIRNVMGLLPAMRGRRLLDLGCGMGTFTLEAAKRGAFAIGIDAAAAALETACDVAAAEGIGGRFVRADAARLPIRSASADIVVAADFTEHLDEATLEIVLGEAARVLRPQGVLVIYTPSPTHLFERLRERGVLLEADPSHIGLRSAERLAGAVRDAGFSIDRLDHLPSHVPVWNLAERALGRWLPLMRRRIGLVAARTEAG